MQDFSFKTILLIIFTGIWITGCATAPTTPAPTVNASNISPDISRLPQRFFTDARLNNLKSLAMGATRSKGWTITESANNHFTVQRPLDANLLIDLTSNAPPTAVGPNTVITVQTWLIDRNGGIIVATQAELVNPSSSQIPTSRTDCTDSLRTDLEKSLNSLYTTWTRYRARLSRATPPEGGWKDAWEDFKAPQPTTTNTVVPGESKPASFVQQKSNNNQSIKPQSSPASPQKPTTSNPAAPTVIKTSSAISAKNSLNSPHPLSSAPSTVQTPKSAPVDQLESKPAELTPAANMMVLPPTIAPPRDNTLNWADLAEQYARQHGCQVSSEGSQLIETRTDSEIHKVPCEGRDSLLVQCKNGTCHELL